MINLPDFPQRLTLELTNACNYCCAMCPSRIEPDRARGMMAPGLFRRIVNQAAEHSPVALVPFFRGENLLQPRPGRAVGPRQIAWSRANSAGRQRSAHGGNPAAALLDLRLGFISFSLDTVHPEEYRRIRHGGDFVRAMANWRAFCTCATMEAKLLRCRLSRHPHRSQPGQHRRLRGPLA